MIPLRFAAAVLAAAFPSLALAQPDTARRPVCDEEKVMAALAAQHA